MSGAVAERISFNAYVALILFHVLVTYAMVAKWVWSDDGFLSRKSDEPLFGCGVVDLSGSGVVRTTPEYLSNSKCRIKHCTLTLSPVEDLRR